MDNWQFDFPSFALGAFFLFFVGVVAVIISDAVEGRKIARKVEEGKKPRG